MTILKERTKPLDVLAIEAGLVDISKLIVHASSAGALPLSFFIKGMSSIYYNKKGSSAVIFSFNEANDYSNSAIYSMEMSRISSAQMGNSFINLSSEAPVCRGEDAVKMLKNYTAGRVNSEQDARENEDE